MNIERFSSPLKLAIVVARKVGREVAGTRWSSEVSMKAHPTLGTSSVAETDISGQRTVIECILKEFPLARFIAEEKGNPALASGDEELVYSVDPVDGTTPRSRSLFMWCTALGVMQRGNHIGGVIHAPEVCGGLTIAGERDRGVYLWEHASSEGIKVSIADAPPKKPFVMLGVNVLRLPDYQLLVSAFPNWLKPRSIAESGALGLSLIAAGRVDAIIQSPQMPWDWIGGYPLVLEAGGAFQAFHLEQGKIVAVKEPTLIDYATDREMLGFVAGHRELVPHLFSVLQDAVGCKGVL